MYKKEIERRINASSPAGLVVICYEIALESLNRHDLTRTRRVIYYLMQTLNFKYALSKDLYYLYEYVSRLLSRCIAKNQTSCPEAEGILQKLLTAWKHAETVSNRQAETNAVIFAGLTYTGATLTEFADQDYSMGYRI